MSVRIRTLLIVGSILLLLVIALVFAAQLILTSGFEQLEAQAVQDNVERVGNAIDAEITRLLATTADWSYWDDTYQFITDSNSDYIEANLAPETLANLELSFMVFINEADEIAFSRAIDRATAEELPQPDLSSLLQVDGFFLTHEEETTGRGGIVLLPDGLFMLASRNILTSDVTGPARGVLILGRSLDAAWGQILSDALKLDFSFLPADQATGATEQAAFAHFTADDTLYLHALNNQTIEGYSFVRDPQNQPALLYRVTMARDILAQGRTTFMFFITSLIVLALVGGALTVLMLDRTVLGRLAHLRDDVERVSLSGDLSHRVQTSGNDELAVLGGKLNEMLAALAQAQQTQQEHAERLRTLVQNAPVILWSVDTGGMLTALDGSELNTLNIQPQRLLGKPLSEWAATLPVREEEFREALRGKTVTMTCHRGNQTFTAHCAPLKDSNGIMKGVIGVATNISGQVTAEESLQQANADLEQKNRQLRRAHEILRSTIEQLRDLIQRGASPDELSEEIKLAEREFQGIS